MHLALFGVVVRMFSLRRERDHVTLAILAFLMVLASAVLTVDSAFLFAFCRIHADGRRHFCADGNAPFRSRRQHSGPAHQRSVEHRHLAFSLPLTSPALVLMILASGALVFFVMPRMSAGYMGAYSFGTEHLVRVQRSRSARADWADPAVQRASSCTSQIDGDRVGGSDLHWRGVALADFDGHTWSNLREQFLLRRQSDNSFVVPPVNAALRSSVAPYITQRMVRPHVIHYRVLMEPIGTNVFFLAPWARNVSGNYRMLAADTGGAIYNFDTTRAISRYEADSDIATAAPADLRAAGRNYSTLVTAGYLRLPAVDPRVPRLAAQITNTATNDFDKAAALENYLQDALRLHPGIAPDCGERSHCQFSFRAQARTLRILRFLDGGHAAHAGNSLARGHWIPVRRVQRPYRQLRGARQRRARLGGSVFPRLRLADLRSHTGGRQRNTAGLEPSRAVRRRYFIVLARLGGQLRYLAPVRARPGRVQRKSRPVDGRPCLGAQALRRDANVGAA